MCQNAFFRGSLLKPAREAYIHLIALLFNPPSGLNRITEKGYKKRVKHGVNKMHPHLLPIKITVAKRSLVGRQPDV